MFLSLLFSFSFEYTDENGIKYDSDSKLTLLEVPLTELPEVFIIPSTVQEIYSKDLYTSAFYPCRYGIHKVTFQDNSALQTIGQEVFAYTSIEQIDFTNCDKLYEISQAAFYHCGSLTEIILPPNIKIIHGASICLTGITRIDIPDSLTRIDDYLQNWGGAIGSNTQLKEVNISKNSNLSYIGSRCFEKTIIETFYIPNSVTTISAPFQDCSKLKTFQIEDDHPLYALDDKHQLLLNHEGTQIYLSVTGVADPLTIPTTITLIHEEAFKSTLFSEITFQGPVELSKKCFQYAYFTSIKIFYGTQIIPEECFEYSKVNTVTLPNSVTTIEKWAFYGCPSLSYISLPESLIEIGNGVFTSCKSLKEIIIPASVEKFGSSVFSDCPGINVTFLNKSRFNIDNGLVFQGTELKEYFGPDGADVFIPRNCTKIPDYLFKNKNISSVTFEEGGSEMIIYLEAFSSSSLQSIIFPSCLKQILERAFLKCYNLKIVNFTETQLSSIPKSCFQECSQLETVIFDYSDVNSIGEASFYNCSKLKTLDIKNSLIELIAENSFRYISAETVEFPHSLTFIGRYAFSNTKIKNIFFYENSEITNFSMYSFAFSNELETIQFPDSLASISGYCFQQCVSLRNVTLSSNTNTLKSYAFINCENLEVIIIPGNSALETIEPFVFSGCKSLKEIRVEKPNDFKFDDGMLMNANQTKIIYFLPTSPKTTLIISGSIVEIADNAFNSCPNIREVYVPVGNLNKVGFQSFYNCQSLSRVILPKNLELISNDAFANCEHLQCGCVELPENFLNDTEITRIGLSNDILNDYCLQKGCYIRFSQISCKSETSFTTPIGCLFIILGTKSVNK